MSTKHLYGLLARNAQGLPVIVAYCIDRETVQLLAETMNAAYQDLPATEQVRWQCVEPEEDTKSNFEAHLKQASKTVSTWSKWKQDMLGVFPL